jgi:hypothetical protein
MGTRERLVVIAVMLGLGWPALSVADAPKRPSAKAASEVVPFRVGVKNVCTSHGNMLRIHAIIPENYVATDGTLSQDRAIWKLVCSLEHKECLGSYVALKNLESNGVLAYDDMAPIAGAVVAAVSPDIIKIRWEQYEFKYDIRVSIKAQKIELSGNLTADGLHMTTQGTTSCLAR